MDYAAGYIEIRAVDGRLFRVERPDWPDSLGPASKDFVRAHFRPGDSLLALDTPSGAELEIEVFNGKIEDQRRARPVIYLDQNMWVRIAQAVHSPHKVHEAELRPTERLIEMVKERRVILPLSAGHAIESDPLGGKWRKELALEMVRLSRGWTMIDPLRVREQELHALFQDNGAESTPAIEDHPFTLDPRSFYAESEPYIPSREDLPADVLSLTQTLSGIQSLVATLLEDSPSPRDGVAESKRWAATHQALAGSLATQPKSKTKSRQVTLLAFLSDLGDDLLRVLHVHSVTPTQLRAWMEDRGDHDIADLPYLGRMRELVHRRLMNPQTRWDVNDLVDVLFLSCAAGYADYVVCEKDAAHHLETIGQKLNGGARIFRSCADLITFLDD
jgi:hypothetical protein